MQTIVKITMMVLMAMVLSVPFAPSDAQMIEPCKEIMITDNIRVLTLRLIDIVAAACMLSVVLSLFSSACIECMYINNNIMCQWSQSSFRGLLSHFALNSLQW